MAKYELLQGNQACALGALKAGVEFCAGYPITPASEVMEILAEKLPETGGRFIQMEDEIAGMGAIIGASVMGKKVLTPTSGPGFDLKQENLAFAAMAEIPCVVVNVQRSGPSTGGATISAQGDLMQAKYGTSGDSPRIVLYPNSVKEIYGTTITAFNLAEKYMTPVILLMDETIGHMRENVCLDEFDNVEIINRKFPDVAPENYHPYEPDETGIVKLAPFANGKGYRYVINGMHHTIDGMPSLTPENIYKTISRINDKVERYKEDIWQWEEQQTEDADIIIFAAGCVSRSASEAVKQLRAAGHKVGLFRPISIWPFPDEPLAKAIKNAKMVLVAEMNRGQLIHKVKEIATDNLKVVPLNIYDGTVIMPEHIIQSIKEAAK
ncbi:MAG: 2-oxoglutarate ferredoxin oxidoreductase subunit alpha [Peptococcaceae bacterium BICA1-8]|nr:MAG: 2-oxoglutarate ferredoxin oxidoreductase subunit alpha [Peptococcaceae bacterium BICA1-8]